MLVGAVLRCAVRALADSPRPFAKLSHAVNRNGVLFFLLMFRVLVESCDKDSTFNTWAKSSSWAVQWRRAAAAIYVPFRRSLNSVAVSEFDNVEWICMVKGTKEAEVKCMLCQG